MRRAIAALSCMLVLAGAAAATAAEVFTITPEEIHPGTEITVRGTQFEPDTELLIGSMRLKPLSVDKTVIRVVIPETFEPGAYKISAYHNNRITMPITIVIHTREPVIDSMTPDTVDVCAESSEVTVTGRNMDAVSHVLAGTIPISGFKASRDRIDFTLTSELIRQFPGSIAVALFDASRRLQGMLPIRINSTPEIVTATVDRGFNFQSIRITGRNFLPGCKLILNGAAILSSSDGEPPQPSRGAPMYDRFQRLSCSELMATRYPIVPDEARIEIVIQNPGGKTSLPYSASLR